MAVPAGDVVGRHATRCAKIASCVDVPCGVHGKRHHRRPVYPASQRMPHRAIPTGDVAGHNIAGRCKLSPGEEMTLRPNDQRVDGRFVPFPVPKGRQPFSSQRAILVATSGPALMNCPPAMTPRRRSTASAFTKASAPPTPVPSACHDVPSQRARLLVVTPPAAPNWPPTYTLPRRPPPEQRPCR